VNRNYARDEILYKPRWLTERIQQAVDVHPVVVITGARQVGKSTLLRHAEPMRNWRYITMDNPDALEQSMSEPEALWAGTSTVVIDEAQRSPGILSAIKRTVDEAGRRKVRFVISGSANLLLMRQVSESLAGRAVYFVLNPMTIGEALNKPAPTLLSDLLSGKFPDEGPWREGMPLNVPEWLLRGFMPPLFDLPRPDVWSQWWEGYVGTYLERDLRQVANIDALTDFRRVMQLSALRTGQLLNQSEIARDARVTQSTTHRYLNLLEATHLAQQVPAYAGNRSLRIVKSTKLFWIDPGLATYLSGYFDISSLASARELGAFFETLIYQHLSVLAQLISPKPSLYYWRTQRGDEVDFVIEWGRKLLAVEVKMSATAHYSDVAGLTTFLQQHSDAVGGVLLYSGDTIQRLGERVIALPWQMITLK
jgi:uncharacterized protein